MAQMCNSREDGCVVVISPSKQDGENTLRVRKSPVFTLQGSKCQVKVQLGWVKIRATIESDAPLTPNFSVTVTLLIGSDTITYPKSTVVDVNKYFWSCELNEIDKQLKEIGWMNFTFKFIFQDESRFSLNRGNSDQLVQPSQFVQKLSEDIAKLLHGNFGCDVELESDGVVIQAHKPILKARSEYFDQLLRDPQEFTRDRYVLPDMDPAALHTIVEFHYSGQLPILSIKLAKNIITSGICDSALRQICKEFIMENLSVENACECLSLACDESFCGEIMAYIIENELPFLDEYWKPFCHQNPELAIFVYDKLVRRFWPRSTR